MSVKVYLIVMIIIRVLAMAWFIMRCDRDSNERALNIIFTFIIDLPLYGRVFEIW